MKKIENSVFSIQVPDYIIVLEEERDSVLLGADYFDEVLGRPKIWVSLVNLFEFQDAQGDSLSSKFFNHSHVWMNGAQIDEQILGVVQDDKTCYQQKASIDEVKSGIHLYYYYHIALFPISADYGIQVMAETPLQWKSELLPVMESILNSISWTDDFGLLEQLDLERDESTVSAAYSSFEAVNDIDSEYHLDFSSADKEQVEFAGLEFSLESNLTKTYISPYTFEFHHEFSIKTDRIEIGLEKELLYPYAEEVGTLRFKFYGKKLFNEKGLYKTFTFEDGISNESSFRLDMNGLELSYRFSGNVGFYGSRFGIRGRIKPYYNEGIDQEIELYFNLDTESLEMQYYQFSNLDETMSFEKDLVRRLDLHLAYLDDFFESIFDFKKLNYLSLLIPINPKLKDQDFDFPDRFQELTELNYLSIVNFPFKNFPIGISQLSSLTYLNIYGSHIVEIPPAVFQMEKLKILNLTGNKLESIPEEINLADLESINLSSNVLKTLPEALLRQQKLRYLNAEYNPIDYLPAAYKNFKGLNLDFKTMLKVLDMQYPGISDMENSEWRDRGFFMDKHNSHLQAFATFISGLELNKHGNELLAMVKQSVGFKRAGEEDYLEIGNHRIGGKPDLPMHIAFPSFYSSYTDEDKLYEFIAQINLSEISEYQDYLPRKGYLFFFSKSIHHFGEDDAGKIIFVEDEEVLTSGKRFESQKEEDFYELMGGQYDSYKLESFDMPSIPHLYAYETNDYIFKDRNGLILDENSIDEYEEEVFPFMEEQYSGDLEMNAYGFTQHESPELQSAISKMGSPEDWIILLKVKSIGSFQWWDAGEIFYTIHKSDLARADFSKCMLLIESS